MTVSTKEPKPTVATVLGTLPMLIVDDSVSILKMTKRAILNSHASMAFIEAKNGQEAYEHVVVSGASFELIVTDIQMPVCDGFEFTRLVRKLEQEKNLPAKIIIGISANDQEKISMEAKESGMCLPTHVYVSISTSLAHHLMHLLHPPSNSTNQHV